MCNREKLINTRITCSKTWLIFACHLSCKLEPHSLFSIQWETSHFPNKDWKINFRDMQMEVSHILIIQILIIPCLWALFGSMFLIIFRISSVENYIVDRDSCFFFVLFCFIFFIFCLFFCESHQNFTVLIYNKTLVSKEIIENIGFFFKISNKFVLA